MGLVASILAKPAGVPGCPVASPHVFCSPFPKARMQLSKLPEACSFTQARLYFGFLAASRLQP